MRSELWSSDYITFQLFCGTTGSASSGLVGNSELVRYEIDVMSLCPGGHLGSKIKFQILDLPKLSYSGLAQSCILAASVYIEIHQLRGAEVYSVNPVYSISGRRAYIRSLEGWGLISNIVVQFMQQHKLRRTSLWGGFQY